MKLEHIDYGNAFDWGQVSEDYAKYRDIYPDEFYKRIVSLGLCEKGFRVLDLGTGTGVLPRHLHSYGAAFVGVDIAANQIAQARKLSEGMEIEYIVSPAEAITFPPETFDTALACQCFKYFNAEVLLPCLYRMLKNNGRFCVMSLVWLPEESEIAAMSEALVLKYNPVWTGSGFRRPGPAGPDGFMELSVAESAGFRLEGRYVLDLPVSFTRETWHGRMKACRGTGASSLPKERIAAFEKEHTRFLDTQPETFVIPHVGVFWVFGLS